MYSDTQFQPELVIPTGGTAQFVVPERRNRGTISAFELPRDLHLRANTSHGESNSSCLTQNRKLAPLPNFPQFMLYIKPKAYLNPDHSTLSLLKTENPSQPQSPQLFLYFKLRAYPNPNPLNSFFTEN
jgi:hypothetical protein